MLLTTFITEVIFHSAYPRMKPAERLGPWLNNALIPAGNGRRMPRGRINKTKKKSNTELEYSWSKVSKTKLTSPRRSTDITKPTRSCNNSNKWERQLYLCSETYMCSERERERELLSQKSFIKDGWAGKNMPDVLWVLYCELYSRKEN